LQALVSFRLARVANALMWGAKFLKHSGRIVCRQSQSVSFYKDVKIPFSEVWFFLVRLFFRLACKVAAEPKPGEPGSKARRKLVLVLMKYEKPHLPQIQNR
jgi:hypothetical protein